MNWGGVRVEYGVGNWKTKQTRIIILRIGLRNQRGGGVNKVARGAKTPTKYVCNEGSEKGRRKKWIGKQKTAPHSLCILTSPPCPSRTDPNWGINSMNGENQAYPSPKPKKSLA